MRIIIRSLRDNPFFIEVDEQATIFCVKSAIFQIKVMSYQTKQRFHRLIFQQISKLPYIW